MQSNAPVRGRFLVNRPYQFRFMAEILIVVILAIGLSTTGTYVLMKGELESGFTTSDITLVNVQQALPRILALSSIVTFFAMALLGVFITLRETHRAIGPVGKMERKFKEMTEGDFSYMLSFRRNDLLRGLDDSINIHLNNLSDFFSSFDRVTHEIVPLLTAIENSEGDAGENLLKIRTLLAELDHYADAFRSH